MRSCDTGQRISCFDSCQLTTTWMCNVRLQVSILARKCEISHWLYCGAEGQVEGWMHGRTDEWTFAQNFSDGYNQIFFAMGFLRVELRFN